MKEAYYFPHFCNARHDRQIKRIRKQLGIEGYGIFFMLLEVLREQSDYKYPIADLDLLADDFGTSVEKIGVVLSAPGLFSKSDDGTFFSAKLILFLQPYTKAREQRSLAGKASANARKNNSLERPFNDRSTTVQQSKVKESKVKESKVKEITLRGHGYDVEVYPHFLDELFCSAWESYLSMRVSIKRKATEKAKEMALEKLHTYDSSIATRMLDQSTFNSWQGIFELKQEINSNEHRKCTKNQRGNLSYSSTSSSGTAYKADVCLDMSVMQKEDK